MSAAGAGAPTISVVMAVFNGEAYVAEAIESVLAQTHPAVQLVVVDDGSDDGTAAVAARWEHALTLVSQARGGIAVARNTGIEHATGELLTFLDADDLFVPTTLEREWAVLAADPTLDMTSSLVQEFLSPELTADERARQRSPGPPAFNRQPTGMLVRRSSFDRVGPFDPSFTRGVGIDWVARAAEGGLRCGELPEVLRQRRLHGENHGLREQADVLQYVRVVKSALDRRRAAP
jgi:glycosyltransferase involved in cell wall biosynthesis